jgi:hypothetical protein
MIVEIPKPKTGNIDEFFQNEAIQNMMQLGTAMPMPTRQPSGEPGVSFCFRETSEYIRQLKQPKFGIKYGRFVVNNVHVFKVALVIVVDDTGANHSIVEMDINWHDLVTGQDVISALASGGQMFLRCYGDNWTCEKLIKLPGDEGLEDFAQSFIRQVEDTEPWQAVDFGHAASTIASKFDLNELVLVELPKQMASFEGSGDFDSENTFEEFESEASTEQRPAGYSEFLQHHCNPLATSGQEGHSKHELRDNSHVMAEIGRSYIEAADLDPVVDLLTRLRILHPDEADVETLKRRHSKITIFIDGYNDDPRELFEIPEVRHYFQRVHAMWPYGLFFFSRETKTLQLLTLCHVGKVVQHEASGATFQVTKDEVGEFIRSASSHSLQIANRIGWGVLQTAKFVGELHDLFTVAAAPITEAQESDEKRRQRHHGFIHSHHETLANVARSGYQEEGRGLVMVLPPEPGQNGFGAMFINQAGLQASGHVMQSARMVERYDPHTQFVVSLYEPDSPSNSSSSYTVRMP